MFCAVADWLEQIAYVHTPCENRRVSDSTPDCSAVQCLCDSRFFRQLISAFHVMLSSLFQLSLLTGYLAFNSVISIQKAILFLMNRNLTSSSLCEHTSNLYISTLVTSTHFHKEPTGDINCVCSTGCLMTEEQKPHSALLQLALTLVDTSTCVVTD